MPSYDMTMPEDSVTLWTWATFTFVEPILERSNKGTLNDIDCWSLSPYFKHKNLFKKYLEYYTMYVVSCIGSMRDTLNLIPCSDTLDTRCGISC